MSAPGAGGAGPGPAPGNAAAPQSAAQGAAGAASGRQLARNSLLNLLAQGTPLVIALLCMPFVVRGLDAERFGLLTLAWAVLSYFGLFDLGLGRAATRFVAEALGRGEPARVPGIVCSAATLQAASAIAGSALLALSAPWIVQQALHVPPALHEEGIQSFRILALALPLVLVSGTFFGVLEALQRFDLASAVRLPSSASTFLVPVLGVALHWKLPGIVACLVVVRGLALIALGAMCATRIPGLASAPRRPAELRALAGFGGWITVSGLVAPLLVYMDRFVLGAVLTMSAVAHYAAPFEMVTRLLIVPASLVGTLFPAFSTLHGAGQSERLAPLAARSLKLLLAGLGIVAAVLVALAPDLLRAWLGVDYAADSALALRILAIGVLVNALAHVPYSLLQALGRPDVTATLHLIELPVHAVVVWFLVRAWGVPGAALAWSLRVALDASLLFTAARRMTPLSHQDWRREGGLRAALVVLPLLVLATLVSLLPAGAWRIGSGVGLPLAGAAILWRRALTAQDRDLVRRALRVRGAT